MEKLFRFFFFALLVTGLIPYIPIVFPFMPIQIFGFNYTGWAWISMLFSSILIIFNIRKKSKFPIIFWLPWTVYISFYAILLYSFKGLQVTLQYILPILIGYIASTFIYTEKNEKFIKKIVSIFSVFIIVIIYFRIFRGGTGGPVTAILFTFLSVVFSVLYFQTHKLKYLILFSIAFLVPIFGVNRMPTLTIAFILPFTFYPIRLKYRLLFIIVAFILGIAVFYSEPFQKKMFHTGSGSFYDLDFENPAFNTSGRDNLFKYMDAQMDENPYFGNGPRADYILFLNVLGWDQEPHNDYKVVRFNYGWIGLILLLFALTVTFLKLYLLKKKIVNKYQLLLWSISLTLFIPFMLLMYTDNILKYTIFFPNLFFAVMGMTFSNISSSKQNL